MPIVADPVLFLCHQPSPGSLFLPHGCLASSVLTLTFAWALTWPSTKLTSVGCLTTRDHCPQHSTVVCPPHSVTLYSIIPSVPAETSSSDHFPAQETTLPPITHAFYWSFISPSALLSSDSLPFLAPSSSLCFCSGSSCLSHLQQWEGYHPEIQHKLLISIHGLLPRVSISPTVK